MADNLLSISNVNLFGTVMEDLEISDPDRPFRVRLASARDEEIAPLAGSQTVDGVQTNVNDFVLIWQQKTDPSENGVYRVQVGQWLPMPLVVGDFVTSGADGNSSKLDYRKWRYRTRNRFRLLGLRRGSGNRRRGKNRQLEDQLTPDARFARIYGFSYEGSYYDLPKPVVFLVHGDGDLVTQEPPVPPIVHAARAPGDSSRTGLAAAIFDFADGLRVWSYDQADYTIRMDVATGMFEQVLLDAMLDGGPGGFDAAGMNARGMNARGMNARGMNARGMNARGMNARGGSSD